MKNAYFPFTLALLSLQIHPVVMFWRTACSVAQTSRMDPILAPGTVSGHVHKFAGGNCQSGTGSLPIVQLTWVVGTINVTNESLQLSPCSTCEVQADKSAYWTPLLYYRHANGSFEEVPNDGMTVYYTGRGGNASNTRPFPPGFMMITGNSSWRHYVQDELTYLETRPVADRVSFRCINEANDIPETRHINRTDCVHGLRAQINFQSCWDGLHLYQENSRHVAYLSGIDHGLCPPSHPVPIPGLFYEVLYWSNRVEQSSGGSFVFANGDATGYGFHGDFMHGWNQDVLTAAVGQCLYVDNGGVVNACAPLAPSDNPNFARICPEHPSLVNESVRGMLSAQSLPGHNPVTFESPENSTAAISRMTKR